MNVKDKWKEEQRTEYRTLRTTHSKEEVKEEEFAITLPYSFISCIHFY